jgi:hypothetical protein
MKLKIVVVDLDLSTKQKTWLIRIGIPAAVLLGTAALAYAGNWTVPHQWSAQGQANYAGADLKASDLDGNFNALATAGAALDGRVSKLEGRGHARFHLSATPTWGAYPPLPSNKWVPMVYDTADFDTLSAGSASTAANAPWHYTVPSDGIYLVMARASFASAPSNDIEGIAITKNDLACASLIVTGTETPTTTYGGVVVMVSDELQFAKGDVISICVVSGVGTPTVINANATRNAAVVDGPL